MDHNDRNAIEGLFSRLDQVSRSAGPRDSEAEAFIQRKMSEQEGSAYFLAQTVVVQEQALGAAQARIEVLEADLARAQSSGGGFLGRLFGGPSAGHSQRAHAQRPAQQAPQQGGFLAGAAQTAVGVAGGMMLGNMLGSMFAGEAQAAEPAAEPVEEFDDGGGFFDDGGDW